MKKLILLIACAHIIINYLNAQNANDIPGDARAWISKELKKAKNKSTIKDYNNDAFFHKDSARVIGYLKGYNRDLGFSTGIVYASNELLRDDYPTVVEVYEDGRFEVTFPIWYPRTYFIDLKDRFIDLYIEPGQTLAIIIDWPKVSATHYGNDPGIFYEGVAGKINNDLNALTFEKPDYRKFMADVKLAPLDFSKEYKEKWLAEKNRLKEQFLAKATSAQAARIAQSKMDNRYGEFFFDFVDRREYEKRQDSTNANLKLMVPDSYYSFIKGIDLNDRTLLTSSEFSSFINRFEYSKPFNTARRIEDNETGSSFERAIQKEKLTDSLVFDFYDFKNNLIYEIAKVCKLPFALKYGFPNDSLKQKPLYIAKVNEPISNPFLRQQALDALHNIDGNASSTGYAVPNNKAGKIFNKIIAPHKGKLIFVDFWATTCGPCVSGIKYNFETRKKFKNNPDFDFLFITSEDESPKKDYDKFVTEQQLVNTVILDIDEYRYLRELFRFNGIPRYAIISAEGNVLNDYFMGNLEYEITKLFPKYKPEVKEIKTN